MLEVNNLRHPSSIIKIVEIVLLIVALGTFFANNVFWGYFVASVIVSCFLNAIIFLALDLMGYTQIRQTPLEILLYVYYSVGCFVSSILLMSTHIPVIVASGVFCLFLTLVYCLDLYFAFANLMSRPITFPSVTPHSADASATNTTTTTSPDTRDCGPAEMPPPPYMPPSMFPGTDTVDRGGRGTGLYNTNPTYPDTLNFPPTNTQTTTSDYPPDVTYGHM